ncbi:MAG: amidohydrolase [Calditrichota bacterium]
MVETEGTRIVDVVPVGGQPIPPDTREFGDDALLIPGFHDAHLHLLLGGLRLTECNFTGVRTAEQFADVLSAYIRKQQPEPGMWIQGSGLDETLIEVNRHDIDKVCKENPVFIWTHDLHSAVVNSAALALVQIDKDVIDPVGGKFERDTTGNITGVLRENAAFVLQRAIPPITAEQAHNALVQAQNYAFSLGITSVSSSVRSDYLPFYLAFSGSTDRKFGINAWRVSEEFSIEQDRFEKIESQNFRLATLKGFTDGALGSRSAAFWEPYADAPQNSGMPLVREGPLARWMRAAHNDGYQVAIHAIGDRANSICLDAVEMAGSGGNGPQFRPRIEHVQHLRERDIKRFAELNVIASMQPIHCRADMRFVEPRLGAERARFSYTWRSLLNAGATLAFGSDWPIEELSPITGIHAAVTRLDENGNPPGGWQPQECISAEEALKAYTSGGAFAAFWERERGTIEVGKQADLTVLSRDILRCSADKISDTKVLMTVAGGKIVYQN